MTDSEMTMTSKPAVKTKYSSNQIIEFAIFDTPGPPPNPITITPKDAAWSDTIKKLIELCVNKWDADYFDPDICDGCSWHLTVRSTEIKVKSSGLNAYPSNFDTVREILELAAEIKPSHHKISFVKKPRSCPNCASTHVASILYGIPNFTATLIEKEKRGEIILAGCVIEPDQPSWGCARCGTRFYKAT